MVDAVGKCGVRGNVELWDDACVETRFASCMHDIAGQVSTRVVQCGTKTGHGREVVLAEVGVQH
jgi:hypothetical protein